MASASRPSVESAGNTHTRCSEVSKRVESCWAYAKACSARLDPSSGTTTAPIITESPLA